MRCGKGLIFVQQVEQVPWVKMILNGGIDFDTNVTVIPRAAFDTITSVHSIVVPNVSGLPPGSSIIGYGLGWMRYSFFGHDVSESFALRPQPTDNIIILYRSSITTEAHREYQQRSLLPSLMVSVLLRLRMLMT
jgi:hypothetical protein